MDQGRSCVPLQIRVAVKQFTKAQKIVISAYQELLCLEDVWFRFDDTEAKCFQTLYSTISALEMTPKVLFNNAKM